MEPHQIALEGYRAKGPSLKQKAGASGYVGTAYWGRLSKTIV